MEEWLCILSPWLALVCLIIWDTTDKQMRFKEPIVLFTAMLALGTIALAVVALLQWATLEKTDATLKEAQRPWVEFNPVIDGDLSWAGEEVAMLAHLDLKNSGHSPALNVRVVSKTLLIWDEDTARKLQAQICDVLNQAKEEGYGLTIFPNNTVAKIMPIEILKAEIAKFKAHPPVFPRPMVVGCISYLYGADHSTHNTGFLYLIRPRPAQLPFVLPQDNDHPIAADKLDLISWGSSRVN